MKTWRVLLILAGGSLGVPACGKDKPDGPSRTAIMTALNQQAEDDFVAYLNLQPPASAAGHIIPIVRISNLACDIRSLGKSQLSAECRYVAYSALGRGGHISTFELDGKRWRLVGDRTME
jgi:hypothetical protein